MTVRPATVQDIPILEARLKDSGEERVSLTAGLCWVAENEQGELLGMLPIRLVWQAEPMMVFPMVEQPMTRRRVGRELGRAAFEWIADRATNRTGIYSVFMVTRGFKQAKWYEKLKFLRIYQDCMIFGRDFLLEQK